MKYYDYPWRIFVNLNVPYLIQKELSGVQNLIPKMFRHLFKWVDSSLIHCTLVFLGDCKEDKILTIKKTIEDLEIKQEMQVSLGEFEFFPRKNHPKVFVVKLNDDNNLISRLYEEIYLKLVKNEFELRNNYVPHITIARIGHKISRKEIKSFIPILKGIEYPREIPFQISKISVIRSILKSEGPEYKILTQNSMTKL